jgi:hypothetical protein
MLHTLVTYVSILLLCRYEFKTPNGLNVAMATAAQSGKVYVVGAAVPSQEWNSSRDTLMRVVKSFRLRNSTSIFRH